MNMQENEDGYTLFEVGFVILFVAALACGALVVYAAIHFIMKVW